MDGCSGQGISVNSFALVSYLPEPVAGFFDSLRQELVSGCHAKAHVTVLPPRPLACAPEEAWEMLKENLQDFSPFQLELGEIQVFPITQVVYVSVSQGYRELERMHTALNRGQLQFVEPFRYHPHLTLAQDLQPDEASQVFEIARRRWSEFAHPRDFTVDRLTFVQNTLENRWQDLAGCALSFKELARTTEPGTADGVEFP
jgi:2'-5' RNA ligase